MGIISSKIELCPKCGKYVTVDGGFVENHNCSGEMNWDQYFFNLTHVVASRSRCKSRQIGALLARDNVVITTGYNGPPRGYPHCETCPRHNLGYASGEGLHLCPAAHAEQNCLANAARLGVNVKDSVMYMTCEVPCKTCMALIVNAGIAGIVCTSLKTYDDLAFSMITRDMFIRTYLL